MNDHFTEVVIGTPNPPMMAAVIASQFVGRGISVWFKAGNDDKLILCYPLMKANEAHVIFQEIQKSITPNIKPNEETIDRNGCLSE